MKHAYQFRYYGQTNSKNYPKLFNYRGTLTTGNILENYGTITHLGIQGKPGTTFYLNGSTSPITIGSTGIYELNLTGLSYISRINFDVNTLDNLETDDSTRGILIDIIYDGIEVSN